MQPLPPYRAHVEPELTLEIGPPGEVQPFHLAEPISGSRNVPQPTHRPVVNGFGTRKSQTFDRLPFA